MEIIIKTKQKFNPFFSFLNHEDVLYPYFKHMKEVMSRSINVPLAMEPERREGGGDNHKQEPLRNHKETMQQNHTTEKDSRIVNSKAPVSKEEPKTDAVPPVSKSDSEDESDSDDEGYLHPLLLGSSSAGKSKVTPTATPLPTSSSSLASSTCNSVSSSNKKVSRTDAGSARKLTIDELMNLHSTSASFVARSRAVNSAPATEGEVTQEYGTGPDADPEAVAAYEFYRQQYYGR